MHPTPVRLILDYYYGNRSLRPYCYSAISIYFIFNMNHNFLKHRILKFERSAEIRSDI